MMDHLAFATAFRASAGVRGHPAFPTPNFGRSQPIRPLSSNSQPRASIFHEDFTKSRPETSSSAPVEPGVVQYVH